jgi:hypothetical protein
MASVSDEPTIAVGYDRDGHSIWLARAQEHDIPPEHQRGILSSIRALIYLTDTGIKMWGIASPTAF